MYLCRNSIATLDVDLQGPDSSPEKNENVSSNSAKKRKQTKLRTSSVVDLVNSDKRSGDIGGSSSPASGRRGGIGGSSSPASGRRGGIGGKADQVREGNNSQTRRDIVGSPSLRRNWDIVGSPSLRRSGDVGGNSGVHRVGDSLGRPSVPLISDAAPPPSRVVYDKHRLPQLDRQLLLAAGILVQEYR